MTIATTFLIIVCSLNITCINGKPSMSKQKSKTDRPSKRKLSKMPGTESEARVAAEVEKLPQNKLVTETRVDAPHVFNTPPTTPVENSTEEAKQKANKDSVVKGTEHTGNQAKDIANTPAAESVAEAVALLQEEAGGCDKESCAGESSEQIRLQATQLGEQLRSRQEDLDRREAQLNARVAQLENDARTTRLWFTETRKDFDRRELELVEKTQQMQQCLARLARVEETSVRRRVKLDAQAERLDKETKSLEESRRRFDEEQQQRREEIEKYSAHEQQRIDTRRQASLVLVRQALSGLERRRAQAESQTQRLLEKAARPSKELLAREETVREATEEFHRRRQQIFETEQTLAAEQDEVRELRRALLVERKELQRLEQQRSQEASDLRDRMQLELEAKRQQIDQRGEELDRAQTALRHIRAELSEMHRETLELRLATEELWMQLSGTIPPATLTRSLSRIRSSLAETYRTENSELVRRKLELRSIGSELAEDHKSLQQQKDELDAWLARRENEIEQQAQRLVAREQELHDQQVGFEEKARAWSTARLEYQQEIRRLREQLDEAAENGTARSGLCGVF